ncbi:MAG TPA: hypothetical protein ENJ79_00670 [Gammaproteobacteria bacterium]|nr:hypothetical protein [Gammaproteobacteria bacterium]
MPVLARIAHQLPAAAAPRRALARVLRVFLLLVATLFVLPALAGEPAKKVDEQVDMSERFRQFAIEGVTLDTLPDAVAGILGKRGFRRVGQEYQLVQGGRIVKRLRVSVRGDRLVAINLYEVPVPDGPAFAAHEQAEALKQRFEGAPGGCKVPESGRVASCRLFDRAGQTHYTLEFRFSPDRRTLALAYSPRRTGMTPVR